MEGGIVLRYRAFILSFIACLLFGVVPTDAARSPLPAYEPIHRIDTTNKVVALTFDDGPDPKYTPIILEVLHRNKVPATFLCLALK